MNQKNPQFIERLHEKLLQQASVNLKKPEPVTFSGMKRKKEDIDVHSNLSVEAETPKKKRKKS